MQVGYLDKKAPGKEEKLPSCQDLKGELGY